MKNRPTFHQLASLWDIPRTGPQSGHPSIALVIRQGSEWSCRTCRPGTVFCVWKSKVSPALKNRVLHFAVTLVVSRKNGKHLLPGPTKTLKFYHRQRNRPIILGVNFFETCIYNIYIYIHIHIYTYIYISCVIQVNIMFTSSQMLILELHFLLNFAAGGEMHLFHISSAAVIRRMQKVAHGVFVCSGFEGQITSRV